MQTEVIVIGAGLAGLACARELRAHGVDVAVLEAGDAVGGRVRTDERQGFLLDRGFQVLQTWYPEARRQLDYPALDLRPFYPGALVRHGGRFHRVSDVRRRPVRLLEMLRSPVGTFADKLRLLGLRRHCLRGDLAALYAQPDRPALELLRDQGFSPQMLERFFKPFFSGVFFEPELAVSSRAFRFVFRAFAAGDTALPARGMGSIPAQLAAHLPAGCVRLGCKVTRLEQRRLVLESGETWQAAAVVVATQPREAARLLGLGDPGPGASRGTSCLYFAAPLAPLGGPYLVLNGEGRGRINSLICLSNLSAHYAPRGQHLISVNVQGHDHNPDALETEVRRELSHWFGSQVSAWQRIASYRIPDALPVQHPPVADPARRTLRVHDWLWNCSEYGGAPSIQWALHAGRRAGEEVAAALRSASTPPTADRATEQLARPPLTEEGFNND